MKRPFSLCLLIVAVAWSFRASAQTVETNESGLLVHLGAVQVQLAAANGSALRLSVSLDGIPQPAPSVFLANTNFQNLVLWQPVQEHGLVGIRTAAGQLLMDPQNGEWTLEDAAGRTLIPRHALGNFKTADASVSLVLGWKKHTPIAVYGCGNGVSSLQQSKVTTGVGNGVAVIPYYWADAGYAVLAVTADDNSPAHWFATDEKSVTWVFPGHTADLYLMPAATLKDAAKAYGQLTGPAPVPPRWAFGYLQSRWGWANRAYIEDTLAKFLAMKLPVDAFIFDFEWYTVQPDYTLTAAGAPEFSDFGLNPKLFPDPAGQIKTYKDVGVHFVGIRKPRMGSAGTLEMLRKNHWDLARPGKKEKFESRDVDFSNPDFREWYIAQSAPLLRDGVDGWWNDEGEGSFTTYYYWNLAEQSGLARAKPGERLWTLNRAFSPGLQRFGAAVWTGDIKSAWDVLDATPTSLLNWTLAGMPYETCDIGGFNGNPSPELLSRWMEAGVFFPVMRSHSEIHVTPRFPWLYGPDALNAIRAALDLRYRLLPYYYSLAHETAATGVPLMRPLVMEFPNDPHVANLSDQWMMGDALLAAPVLSPGGKRSVYLPDDDWYPFESNAPLAGKRAIKVTAALDEIPLYVRAGSILPLGPVIQHTSQVPGGPLELEIYPGKDAEFTLDQDDGETTGYALGQELRITFQWHNATGQLTWTRAGNYSGDDVYQSFHVTVFDPRGKLQGSGMLDANGALPLAPASASHKLHRYARQGN